MIPEWRTGVLPLHHTCGRPRLGGQENAGVSRGWGLRPRGPARRLCTDDAPALKRARVADRGAHRWAITGARLLLDCQRTIAVRICGLVSRLTISNAGLPSATRTLTIQRASHVGPPRAGTPGRNAPRATPVHPVVALVRRGERLARHVEDGHLGAPPPSRRKRHRDPRIAGFGASPLEMVLERCRVWDTSVLRWSERVTNRRARAGQTKILSRRSIDSSIVAGASQLLRRGEASRAST